MFRDSLKEHFRKEELLLEKVQHCHDEINKISKEIIAEHKQLTRYFLMLDKTVNPEDIMDILGNTLDVHIRKEERVLFPLIQEHCSEKVLKEVEFLLQ